MAMATHEHRVVLFHACLLLLLAFGLGPSVAADRSTYIVHMDKSVMPKDFAAPSHWYSSTLKSVTTTLMSTNSGAVTGDEPHLLYTYDHAVHGFSAVLSKEELQALEKSPGFVSAHLDVTGKMDTTHTYRFLSLNDVSGLWPASKYGEDVIVGVIDTGIWPESECFNDLGMTEIPARWNGTCDGAGTDFDPSLCNRKLIGARYFNKGAITHLPPGTRVSNTTRDAVGHGTHTSSTVAGNYVPGASFFGYAEGTSRGIAPRARVAMYKVISEGGVYTSDVIAGIDQAIADGVDVISISMGFDGVPLYEDPIAVAGFHAMAKGVFLSSSAGNEGPELNTLHNGIPWTLTVGASSVDRDFAGQLTLGNGETIFGWSLFPANALINDYPLIYNETIKTCNTTDLPSNSIVLCEMSEYLSVFEQIEFIAESPVAGAILVSNDSFLFEAGDLPCPATVISPKEGERVITYAKNDVAPTASIKFQQTVLGTTPAPAVSSYTSRGPSPSYRGILKPDLVAPGTRILAGWSPISGAAELGSNIVLSSDFNLISGTSMACPHAAGVAALLKGAHPDWTPAAIRSAMMTTSSQVDNTLSPIKDVGNNYEAATPLAMGAGHVDPNRALDPGLVYDAGPQDYVNLLCALNYTSNQISAIVGSSNYSCSSPSLDLNYPSFIVFSNSSSTVQRFRRTVTNVGDGGATTYKVTVNHPSTFKLIVSPGTLVFREKFEKRSFVVSVADSERRHGKVAYGSIMWTDGGNHTVRSPVVIV
ncbi:hypothetical protein H6P81_015333 [Aristolochia fimbriata]|uniref:Uncharacterized protein n=1 Tax=Aristolochia fimbriata TaxID=158543 RepID=A0AAV7E5B1_ARIFI|nr:hypothetical protein H6P81_015333 [Aristolochia fimbriata]